MISVMLLQIVYNLSGSMGNIGEYQIWKDLQLAKWLQIDYNSNCPRETNLDKEVGKMRFFFGNFCCNSDCSSIWQILSQLCGFGC